MLERTKEAPKLGDLTSVHILIIETSQLVVVYQVKSQVKMYTYMQIAQ